MDTPLIIQGMQDCPEFRTASLEEKGTLDPNEVFARDGLLDDLKRALSERILNAELDEHLDDERGEGAPNRRNGHSRKSVLTGDNTWTGNPVFPWHRR
jgi:transposase-like protein